jgi:hypothetical protein
VVGAEEAVAAEAEDRSAAVEVEAVPAAVTAVE